MAYGSSGATADGCIRSGVAHAAVSSAARTNGPRESSTESGTDGPARGGKRSKTALGRGRSRLRTVVTGHGDVNDAPRCPAGPLWVSEVEYRAIEIIDEMVDELGFARRGRNIETAIRL